MTSTTLIKFLHKELNIPNAWIALAESKGEAPNLLPMVLWQYGLLTLEQLEQMFDCLSTV